MGLLDVLIFDIKMMVVKNFARVASNWLKIENDVVWSVFSL